MVASLCLLLSTLRAISLSESSSIPNLFFFVVLLLLPPFVFFFFLVNH